MSESEENVSTVKSLICNARIYTQADDLSVNSMAVGGELVEAIGDDLHRADDFRNYRRIDLRGRAVVPGFVDAHTHFYYFALTFGRVSLDGVDSLDACLAEIRKHARAIMPREWVVGQGYAPDRFRGPAEPDRHLLDRVTAGRPAFIFSKDQHSAWVNTRALDMAGISARTPDPRGGRIERSVDGAPTGILREIPAYGRVYECIPRPSRRDVRRLWSRALAHAYRKGVTGVHSFDGPEAFVFLSELARKNRVGLRINYYPPAGLLPQLAGTGTRYGTGTDFFRIAGVKIFADGSLGSRTALCFRPYLGDPGNCGIEVTPTDRIQALAASAARLGLPCAVHAIGDRAVASVLDALEAAPPLTAGARHRIEHLQLVRRRDLPRLKRLSIVASMQPSHCPSDIPLVRKYWGARGTDAYIFRTIIDRGIDVAFGSDVPIEPLDPIAGIAAAVRRARPGSRHVFYPEERLRVSQAIYHFTVGPAIAAGEADRRGRLVPGYPADFVVLSDDPLKVPTTRLHQVKVLATVVAGQWKYRHSSLHR